MHRTSKGTQKRKHASLSPSPSALERSSSPDPPIRIAPSFGPLSDAHPSIQGRMKTNVLEVIKNEIHAFCKAHAPPKPARGPPHKLDHQENTLQLCYGFSRDQQSAGRWFSRYKTPPLDNGVFEGLKYYFKIMEEIMQFVPPSPEP
ncbi:hypothetical protein BJ912DRAFT_1069018 [Pholiota molesta]|nr:hypothetical protein BJ912DRAFT_1069018 [Pholiota molesta]